MLTTWEQAHTFLGCSDEDKTIVETLIGAASDFIENYCSRILTSTSYTAQKYDGDSINNYIMLRQTPVTVITSVLIEDQAETNYYIDAETGKLSFNYKLLKGQQNISITYTAGYTVVPKAIETACLIITDVYYKAFTNHQWTVTAVGVSDQRISYDNNIPSFAYTLLQPYRKSVV